MKAWPADRVSRRSVDGLEPYPKNARIHSPAQIAQIAKSIEDYGFTVPVLTDEAGRIIAGHGRVEAAKSLGLSDVPVMTAEGWSEAQRRAYTILDNKIALNASWDDALLGAEFAELEGLGFDLGNLGFDPPELAAIRDTLARGLIDPDLPAPEPPIEPVATVGDLWALGRHRLLCGDATKVDDVKNLLGEAKPHLMVTDPPYGVDYDPAWRARAGVNRNRKKMGTPVNDDRANWSEAWALFSGDVAYVWHGGLHAGTVADSLVAQGFTVVSQIIWVKDRLVLSRGDYHWQHEPCWYAVRKGKAHHWCSNRSQTTVWQIPARDDSGHGHGTQKPVECMKHPIENNSQAGKTVFDPFVGSGTTIIAAEMTARKCYAIEINPSYIDVSIIRWQNFTGKEAKLGDKTFAQISEQRKQKAA